MPSKKLKGQSIQKYDLAVVLNGCENWFAILKKEYGLKIFRSRWFRRTFGPKREKVIEEIEIGMQNEEFYGFFSHPI